MATKVRIPSRVTEVLEINYGIEELKRTSHMQRVVSDSDVIIHSAKLNELNIIISK